MALVALLGHPAGAVEVMKGAVVLQGPTRPPVPAALRGLRSFQGIS